MALEPTCQRRFFYFVDIYARSKGEVDDTISSICSYLNDKKLLAGQKYVFCSCAPEPSEPRLRPSSADFVKKYYSLTLNGLSGYGFIENDNIFDTRTLTIDADVKFNSLVITGGNFSKITIPNTAYDSTIEKDRYGAYTITSNETKLISTKDLSDLSEYRSYLVFNTADIPPQSAITSLDLYFYMDPTVSVYEGTIYVLTGASPVPPIITEDHWTMGKASIGDVKFTSSGWNCHNIADFSLFSGADYMVISVEPKNWMHEKYYICANEGANNSYLVITSGEEIIYDTHHIIDKYSEDDMSGFKLVANQDGDLDFTIGFGLLNISASVSSVISTGIRQHVVATFDYKDYNFLTNIFVDEVLIYSGSNMWGLPPNWNDKDVFIGKKDSELPDTSYSNMTIYGLRLSKMFSDSSNLKVGENLYSSQDDICYFPFDEGIGCIAYDFVSNRNITFSSDTGCSWENYLMESGGISSVKYGSIILRVEMIDIK